MWHKMQQTVEPKYGLWNWNETFPPVHLFTEVTSSKHPEHDWDIQYKETSGAILFMIDLFTAQHSYSSLEIPQQTLRFRYKCIRVPSFTSSTHKRSQHRWFPTVEISKFPVDCTFLHLVHRIAVTSSFAILQRI